MKYDDKSMKQIKVYIKQIGTSAPGDWYRLVKLTNTADVMSRGVIIKLNNTFGHEDLTAICANPHYDVVTESIK